MQFGSALPASLQSSLIAGGALEIPPVLIPALEVPLPIMASLPSPAGGVNAIGVEGSFIATQSINIAASSGAGTTIIITCDRGVYHFRASIYCLVLGATLSAAAPYRVRLGMLNPEGTAFGTWRAQGFNSDFGEMQDYGIYQFQKPGWRIAIANENTGVGETIGAIASVYACKLL